MNTTNSFSYIAEIRLADDLKPQAMRLAKWMFCRSFTAQICDGKITPLHEDKSRPDWDSTKIESIRLKMTGGKEDYETAYAETNTPTFPIGITSDDISYVQSQFPLINISLY